MFKKIVVLILIVLCFGCTSNTAKGTEINWVHSMDEGLQTAKQEDKPIMIDFYADWCGWCTKLDEDTYTNSTVQELADKFVNIKINTDKDQASASKYGVRGLPTIVFLNASGEEVDRNIGYATADVLSQKMRNVLGE